MDHLRQEAEGFLRLLQNRQRGRLLLCLGQGRAARPTQALLGLAGFMQRRGLEVALAYVEPAEIGPEAPALERIAHRRLEYRGLAVEEMDLAAVLRRRPLLAVVQDLAHANVPGASHASRYQDVEELLAAGISVLASADPRQLEGLPGLPPLEGPAWTRKALPASFWRRADQIILLEDGPPAGGEPPQAAPLPAEALAALGQYMSAPAGSAAQAPAPGPAAACCQRLMVCLPAALPQALSLLRLVEGVLRRNGGSWFAVHVRPSQQEGQPPDMEQVCQQARQKGAEVVFLQGKDPLHPLLDFASAHGVRHIALGRSRGAWKGRLGLSLAYRLLRHGSEFDLHILDLAQPEA